MDHRLLALLLFCLCRHGSTDDGDSDAGSIPPVPVTPLIPSQPTEDLGTTVLPSCTKQPLMTAHTHDSSDLFSPVTSTPWFSTSVPEECSSEEELDGGCGAKASSTTAKRALGRAIMKLGLELLQNLKPGPEQPNVIISPLSISLALSQLALGAANETEELLLHHLHADTLPCYHKSLCSHLHHLRNSALQVATRIYLRPGFEAKAEFIHESERLYGSEPVVLEGLKEVNDWVEKATNGQVTDFLSSLPSDVVLMLINAVHFKGEWQARFDPHFTSSDFFHVDDKTTVNVEMMLAPKYPLSLLDHNDLEAQVARFPFKKHMSLLVVMPMSGPVNVSAIAAKLNTSELYERWPRERTMQVRLPKFKLEYSQELEGALTSIGLGQLFSEPNLSGIGDGPLLVSSVQHKSSMEINEEGAEAAAATSVVISRSNPSFNVNQPFFFALVDDITLTPVFLGVITNPNPGAASLQNGVHVDKGSPDKNGHSSGSPPK